MASAAIVSLTATMSSAEAAQPYASLFGGASILQDQSLSGKSYTRTTTSLAFSSDRTVDTSFKTGFVLGGNAGIEWGQGLRTELELAFRQNSSKNHAHLITHYSYGSQSTGGHAVLLDSQSNEVPANIRLRAWSLMANAWYDFDLGLPVTPYVGGGIGMAMVKVSGTLGRTNSATTGEGGPAPRTLLIERLYEKNDTVFAWQLGAGVSFPISDGAKLFADYRYFSANDAHLKFEPGFHGGDFNADFNSHNLMVGVRFNF
jgi:opacity protein-like surface antigen